MTELLAAILRVQEMYRLSDRQFSQSVHIDPGTWSRIKSKQRNPGTKFLRALTSSYPELKLEVMKYLGEGSTNV